MNRSELGLGLWQAGGGFGFWEDQNRKDSLQVLHKAIRSDIIHYDTAQSYGNGTSEQLLGQQCKRFQATKPRNSFFFATKLQSQIPDKVEQLVGKSLRRLCTDYLDLLYLHWPSSGKDPRYMLDAMRKDKRIKYIGVCNFPPALLAQLLKDTALDYFQCPISLLWTRHLSELLHLCKERNIKIVGYSPLGMGLLSGKHSLPPDDARSNLYCYQIPQAYKAFLDLTALLSEIASKHAATATQIALSWSLDQQAQVILTGARNKEQLDTSLMAKELILTEAEKNSLKEAAEILQRQAPAEMDNIFAHQW